MPNTITPLPRDLAGRFQLPGLAEHVKVADFAWLASVPTDMTTTGSSTITGTLGESVLTMACTPGNNASIKFNAPVNANSYESIALTVDFELPAMDGGFGIFLDLTKNTSGVGMRRSPRVLRTKSPTPVDLPVVTPIGQLARQCRYTQTLLILPPKKQIALLEGDQVVNSAVASDILFTDPLDALFTISGTGTLYLRRMELRLRR